MGQRIAAGFDLFSRFQDNSTTSRFESRTTGGTLRATFPITEEFSITPRYSLSQTEIKIPNKSDRPTTTDCLVQAAGLPKLLDLGRAPVDHHLSGTPDCVANGEASVAIKEAAGRRLTSLVGLTLIYNSLDNVQTPKSGFYAELRPEIAGLGGGDSKFTRISADARYYARSPTTCWHPLGAGRPHHGLRRRPELRIIDHTSWVRAWCAASRAPASAPATRPTPAPPAPERSAAPPYVGASLEFQFPIPLLPREIGIRGAVFADAGTLFNFEGGRSIATAGCPTGTKGRSFDVNRNGVVDAIGVTGVSEVACVRDKNVLRSSVGASILWNSPLGPIRFDYAYALSYDKGVNVGGVQVRRRPPAGIRFSGGTPVLMGGGRSRPPDDGRHVSAGLFPRCVGR